MNEQALSILRHRTHQPAVRAKITLRQHMFTFLMEGEKTVHFAGTRVTVRPHQFIMLAAGNCLMSEKLAAADGPYHSILLLFDPALATDFFDRYPSLSTTAIPPEAQPFVLFEKDAFLIHFIHSLDCMLQGTAAVHPGLQRVKLEELFLYLSIHYPGQMQLVRHMHTPAADDLLIRQAVTAHMDDNVTVEELAFLCNMSLSSFKRKFARIYGNSPNRWLLEKKMERAAALLRQNNRKASEIYYELGYENLSSFIQSFKQIYGITPKQYQLSN